MRVLRVFVEDDEAQDFLDFLEKRKAHNVQVDGKTQNGFTVISFSPEGKAGRPPKLPKDKIVELRKQGKSYSVIANELGVSRASVARIAKQVPVEYDDDYLISKSLPDKEDELAKLIDSLKWQIANDRSLAEKNKHMVILKKAQEKRDSYKKNL
jgi:predicted transcriptional regulator